MSLSGALRGWRRTQDTPSQPASGDVRSTGRTHVGRVRAINEDRLLDDPAHGLWAVADGMGGHSAGDIAAEAAVTALRALAEAGTLDAGAIETALLATNDDLRGATRGGGRMSGATVVAMAHAGDVIHILWAGDCRAYRLRGGALEALTRDHSVVQELVDVGALTWIQAARHPQAHVVTRALGAADVLVLDRLSVVPASGDIYLLCSDGLSRLAPDIAGILGRSDTLDDTADALMAAALAADGSDNISFVLVRFG